MVVDIQTGTPASPQVTQLEMKVRSYRTLTNWGYKWTRSANGNLELFKGTTSGYGRLREDESVYRAEVTCRCPKDETLAILDTLIENKDSAGGSEHMIHTIASCTDDELVFGAELDHTGLEFSIVEIKSIAQTSWKVLEVVMTLKAVDPSSHFTYEDDMASLPEFRYITYGVARSRESTEVHDSVGGSTTGVADLRIGSRTATIEAILSKSEMKQLRGYYKTHGAYPVDLPTLRGVDLDFRTDSCIITELEDLGMHGLHDMRVKVTFAEYKLEMPMLYIPSDTSDITSMTDHEGNSYPVVKLGDRYWTAANHRAETFNDGTPIEYIPEYLDREGSYTSHWSTTDQPAWSYHLDQYEQQLTWYMKKKTGKVYNWYAVESGKLAPDGWRVPSKEDAKSLQDLGLTQTELGKALASKEGWYPSGGIGTDPHLNNTLNFDAYPSGFRSYSTGEHGGWSNGAYWWTTTEDTGMTDFAYYASTSLYTGYYSVESWPVNYGLAIRLVKDAV